MPHPGNPPTSDICGEPVDRAVAKTLASIAVDKANVDFLLRMRSEIKKLKSGRYNAPPEEDDTVYFKALADILAAMERPPCP